jgi:chemotaxis signal transduction protein
VSEPTAQPRFLVADLGACRLGVDAKTCVEVVPLPRCTRVPWAPGWVRGVLYKGGRLYTVVDLARFLEVPGGTEPRVALLLDRDDVNLAFAATGVAVVEGRTTVRVSELKLFVPRTEWILESLSTPDTSFQHLDLAAVVEGVVQAF